MPYSSRCLRVRTQLRSFSRFCGPAVVPLASLEALTPVQSTNRVTGSREPRMSLQLAVSLQPSTWFLKASSLT